MNNATDERAIELLEKVVDSLGGNAEVIWTSALKGQMIDSYTALGFCILFILMSIALFIFGFICRKDEYKDKTLISVVVGSVFLAISIACAYESAVSFITPEAEAFKELFGRQR